MQLEHREFAVPRQNHSSRQSIFCVRFGRVSAVNGGGMYVRRGLGTFVQSGKSNVQTIETARDALTVKNAVKLFSTAFGQSCGLQEVNQPVPKV